MLVYCVTNQKGGVGKTTTADALAAYFKAQGQRVLAVDLDTQCNLSTSYRADRSLPNIRNALDAGSLDAVQHTEHGDIIAGSIQAPRIKRASALADLLSLYRDQFDVVVLDTPPALNEVTFSALMAADLLIVPTSADIFGIDGLEALRKSVESARRVRPRLRWGGVIVTRHNVRTSLGKMAISSLQRWGETHDIFVSDCSVREGIAIREAQAVGKDLFTYAPRSAVAGDYRKAFADILKHMNDKEE